MDVDHLKKLFLENKGDVIVKGKNTQWKVISYILKLVSPTFCRVLDYEMKKGHDAIIDLSIYDNDNIEILLKYVYYKYMVNDINTFKNPILLCELVRLFDI